MDKKPKILVTIPNYNHAQYLKESITSIQNQTYDNLDICVVDDGSKNPVEVKDILSEMNIPSLKIKEFTRIKIGE